MRIPWGRVWLALAAVVAIGLAVGFTLQYLGAWDTSSF